MRHLTYEPGPGMICDCKIKIVSALVFKFSHAPHSLIRFILVLLYPVMQVFLLALIDTARKEEEDEVIMMGNHCNPKRWKVDEKGWVIVAKVIMPIAFIFSGILIVAPGIVNTLTTH